MKIADGGEAKFGVREGELSLCVPKGGRDQEVCKHGEWGRQSGDVAARLAVVRPLLPHGGVYRDGGRSSAMFRHVL